MNSNNDPNTLMSLLLTQIEKLEERNRLFEEMLVLMTAVKKGKVVCVIKKCPKNGCEVCEYSEHEEKLKNPHYN